MHLGPEASAVMKGSLISAWAVELDSIPVCLAASRTSDGRAVAREVNAGLLPEPAEDVFDEDDVDVLTAEMGVAK